MTERQLAKYKFNLNIGISEQLTSVLEDLGFSKSVSYDEYFLTKKVFRDNTGNEIILNIYRGQEGEEMGEVEVPESALPCVTDVIF